MSNIFFTAILFLTLISVETLGQENIHSIEKTKLITFFAEWCQPCNYMKKFMYENPSAAMSNVLDKYEIIEYNFDHSKEENKKYNIKVVPTIIVIRNDKEIARMEGFNSNKLHDFLNKYN